MGRPKLRNKMTGPWHTAGGGSFWTPTHTHTQTHALIQHITPSSLETVPVTLQEQ